MHHALFEPREARHGVCGRAADEDLAGGRDASETGGGDDGVTREARPQPGRSPCMDADPQTWSEPVPQPAQGASAKASAPPMTSG